MFTRQMRRSTINRGLIAETGVIPPGYQFFQDSHSFKVLETKKVLTEDINGKEQPVMKVTGLFQESDLENANGRIYPRAVLSEAVKLILDDVSARSVYGEYDHPSDARIHLKDVSHLITKLWMDGNKVYGEAEILDNQPNGRCLRGLFERKCQLGISSRGVGDMEMKESTGGKQTYMVLPGFTIVTFDVVAEPSVRSATLEICESLNKKLKPIKEAHRKNLLERSKYEKMLLEEINKFFDIE